MMRWLRLSRSGGQNRPVNCLQTCYKVSFFTKHMSVSKIYSQTTGGGIYILLGAALAQARAMALTSENRLGSAWLRLGHDIEMCSGITVLHHRGKVYIFLGASGLLGSARLGSASARLDSALARRLRSSQNKRPPGGTRFSFVKSRNIYFGS